MAKKSKDEAGGEDLINLGEIVQMAKAEIMPDLEGAVEDALAEAFGKALEDEGAEETEEATEETEDDEDAEGAEDDAEGTDETEDDAETDEDAEATEDEEGEDEEEGNDEEDEDGDEEEEEADEEDAAKSVDVEALTASLVKKLGKDMEGRITKAVEAGVAKRMSELEIVSTGKRSVLVEKGTNVDASEGFDFSKVKKASDVPDEFLMSIGEDDSDIFKSLDKDVRKALLSRWMHLHSR